MRSNRSTATLRVSPVVESAGCRRGGATLASGPRPLGALTALALSLLLAVCSAAAATHSAYAPPQSARARITTITNGGGENVNAPATGDLAVVRAGTVVEEPIKLQEGMSLDLFTGDELRAVSGVLTVELDCNIDGQNPGGGSGQTTTSAGNGQLTFSEPFRVVVMPASAARCAFNLLSGTVYAVTSNEETQITAGDTTAGSPHTQWGVRASRNLDRMVEEVLVFDGTVQVSRAAEPNGAARRLNAGRAFSSETGSVRRIDPVEFDRAAASLAAVDVARAVVPAAERQAAFGAIKSGYLGVLRTPEDPSARLDLIAQQINYSTVSWTTLYQIEQAESRAPTDAGDRAMLGVTKGLVYEQLGNRAGGERLYRDALRQRNEAEIQAFNNAVIKYRLNEEVLRARSIGRTPALQGGQAAASSSSIDAAGVQRAAVARALTVQAQASPARVRKSQFTRVIVDVTDPGGAPVAGAQVLVEAGGGAFPDGETSFKGTTNAEGRLMTRWSCQLCDERYRFDVTVTMNGYSVARANAEVAIAGDRRP